LPPILGTAADPPREEGLNLRGDASWEIEALGFAKHFILSRVAFEMHETPAIKVVI
jgi:hypothetical protein